jgi:hypothetical protein
MIVFKQIFNYCKHSWIKRIKKFKLLFYKKAEELTAILTSFLM